VLEMKCYECKDLAHKHMNNMKEKLKRYTLLTHPHHSSSIACNFERNEVEERTACQMIAINKL